MGISEQYSKEVRENLSYFPSWEPGDAMSPGDVGEIIKGVFHRQTTLKKLFPLLPVKVRHDAKPNSMIFQSENSVSIRFQGGAAAPHAASAVASGSLEITFSRAGAVAFHATNSSRHFIENLHEIREYIEQNRKEWPKGYALVSHVEEAERFAVFVSGAAGGSVGLAGKLDVLQQFQLAESTVAVTSSKSIGYQRIGSGPILLRLYALGFFGGFHPQEQAREVAEAPEEEFQELSPHDPRHD
jgi:hypothetical protein